MKKSYQYFSGHETNIRKLEGRVENPRHALVLDKFIFLSINSNFALLDRPDELGWFCVEYKKLATLTGYKERTIKAIVKSFEENGLIQKIRKIVNNRCRSCIRVTDKATHNLGISKNGKTDSKIIGERSAQPEDNIKKLDTECTSESAKNALAYNEERKKEKEINIITRNKRDKYVDSSMPQAVSEMFERVGERLTTEQTKRIYGAVCNYQKQSGKSLSNPAEFTAWIVFSILNAKFHLRGCETFEAKLNTIMKIARSPEGFKKPRGFHSHWDIGKSMRDKVILANKIHQKEKKVHYESYMFNKKQIPDQPLSDEVTESRFVPRKAKELWEESSELRALKSKKAELMSEINAVISEMKAIPILFAGDLCLQKKQKQSGDEKIRKIEGKIKQVEVDITKHNASIDSICESQWQGLYEAG